MDEVSAWYTSWKDVFKDLRLENLDGVKEGFRSGLDMMNQVSSDVFVPSVAAKGRKQQVFDVAELSFKDLVQELASEASVVFVPLGRRHTSGKELFKLGSLHAYIDNGVLFVGKAGEFKYMGVEEALELAAR